MIYSELLSIVPPILNSSNDFTSLSNNSVQQKIKNIADKTNNFWTTLFINEIKNFKAKFKL